MGVPYGYTSTVDNRRNMKDKKLKRVPPTAPVTPWCCIAYEDTLVCVVIDVLEYLLYAAIQNRINLSIVGRQLQGLHPQPL